MSSPRAPVTFRPGRRAPHPEETHPRMHARGILRGSYSGNVPAVVDWHTGVTLPVDLNSQIGDCTIADEAHAVGVFTYYGQGTEVVLSDADVLTVYERVGGYVPGNPSTDQGAIIQDVLADWRKTGIGTPAHQILAFFQVDHTNATELKACCWLFGGVTLGVNLPNSAVTQFNTGQPWSYDPNADNSIAGGHDVRLLGVDADGTLHVATWGTVQTATPLWLAAFCEEAWSEADEEWVKNNTSPEGLDTAALNAVFAQLTGQPGPFTTGPTPSPPPSPTPAPPAPIPPTPVPTSDTDRALAVAIPETWLDAYHIGGETRMVRDALKTWFTATGLTPGRD